MIKRLIIFLLFVQLSFGQTKQGVELCLEYQKAVSGFTSEIEANKALDRILNVIGASKNFTLIPCDNINNALAITFNQERYILFDSEFMNQITKLTNDWSSIFILAHEVGHHINGHTREALMISVLDDITLEKKREEELEADEFASFILAKLGATYDEIKAGIELITTNQDDTYSTHPSQNKRLAAIKIGYDRAKVTTDITNNNYSKSDLKKHNKKIKVNSWEYTDKTLDGVINDWVKYRGNGPWNSSDPFEKKEWDNLYAIPDIERTIKVNSIGTEKTASISIKLEKFTRENKYRNGSRINISKQNEIDIYSVINIEFSDLFPLYLGWGEYNSFEEFKKYLEDERNKGNYKKSEEQGVFYIPELNARSSDIQLRYIIDDYSGTFIMSLPGYREDLTLSELELSPSTIYPNSSEDMIEFIERLKKGKKLYLKFGAIYDLNEKKYLTNETFTLGDKTFKLNDLFDNETTYTFDLTGSSKALKL